MRFLGIKLGHDKPHEKDLNQLIYDVAEYQRTSDTDEIFRRLGSLQLFAPAAGINFQIEHGRKIRLETGMELQIPTQEVQGVICATFLVNKDDPRLGDNFIGVSVKEALDIVEAMEDVHGIAFYNDKRSYILIHRKNFAVVRQRHLT